MHNPDRPSGPDVLITGIPRSGTSFFCTLLHKLRDCVAINEPEEIFRYVNDTAAPWGMASYYARLRADISAGRPIENKIHEGKLIEDTAVVFNEELYTPKVSSAGFLLATKNTLAYIARLPMLARAMPEAAIVACVRHPFDAIASWKGTFNHLSGATVEQIRVGNVADSLMSPAAHARLEQVAASREPEPRRALFWRHLALLILEDRARVHSVLRYEDLVADPEQVLRTLLGRLRRAPPFEPLEPIAPATARRHRSSAMTDRDYDAIHDLCADVAREFDYDLAVRPAARTA